MMRFDWYKPGLIIVAVMASATIGMAAAQPLPKARVADLIVKVENGVDEFRNYLEKRGDNAKDAKEKGATTAQGDARRAKRGTSTEAQKNVAKERKDELDDALGDLNRSTNQLRRKFDATDKWQETRVQVERMLEDGRKINQAVVRGNYGTEVARLWGVLRPAMNDLARAYGLQPLAL
jgi:chromosome segregation ATPase